MERMGLCIVCKNEFVASRLLQKFCGSECRENYYRWRGGGLLKPEKKICPFCNKEFKTVRGAVFCSDRCRSSDYHKNKDFRIKARMRDNFRCQRCDRKSNYFHVHHIIPHKCGGGNNSENLLTLCVSCHLKTHKELNQILNNEVIENGL